MDAVQTRVGVWLMPDNRRSGALEEFLQDLVSSNDSLLPIAEQSTQRAKERGARFPDSDQLKAVLHAWLAWQARPGLPYGSAVRARYFSHDSAAAWRSSSGSSESSCSCWRSGPVGRRYEGGRPRHAT